MPKEKFGILFLLIQKDERWSVKPYLIKDFSISECSNQKWESVFNSIEAANHLKDLPEYSWENNKDNKEVCQHFNVLIDKYLKEKNNHIDNCKVLLLATAKSMNVIYSSDD